MKMYTAAVCVCVARARGACGERVCPCARCALSRLSLLTARPEKLDTHHARQPPASSRLTTHDT